MNELFEAFDKRADRVCKNAAERENNLAGALQACEGLFPILAVSRFTKIDRKRTKRWLEEAAANLQLSRFVNKDGSSYVLSTWDFCDEKNDLLSSATWQSDSRVCLLGTPSLTQHLPIATQALPNVLIDLRSPSMPTTGNVIHFSYDINSLVGCEFAGAFDVCFLDPPWYLENYFKWIDVAVSYCCDGGVIAFALLGSLTRPSAMEDRERILQHCRVNGLTVELRENFVLYEVPSFERHMLQRAGIPPVRWKRADLVIATYDRPIRAQTRAEVPPRLLPFQQAHFGELTIDIVFDRYEHSAQKFVLIPPGGYWMETPSRREAGLQGCNVFTSNGARLVSPRPIDLYAELVSMHGADFSSCREQIERLGFPVDIFCGGPDNYRGPHSMEDDKSHSIGRLVRER